MIRPWLFAIFLGVMLALGASIAPGNPGILCLAEDSANCVWLAQWQGNGQGASFIDIGGTPYYFGR